MASEKTPEKLTKLEIREPQQKAAGLTAVRYSMRHVMEHMHLGEGLKTLAKVNQKNGFDCPGCAWPDPDGSRARMAEYCENGVKALAEEATKRRIDAAFFSKHSVDDLGKWSDYELGNAGRLVSPMYLAPGERHYRPLHWEEAFAKIGATLSNLSDPNQAIFYTSGRTSNEAAFLYQLFVRAYGTNNLPDCSNMCHESSGSALGATLGLGKGSVTLEDIHSAELILCIGQNPGTNHPRMLTALEKCKENGGSIISINPLPEAGLQKFVNPQRPGKILSGGTTLTDLHLPVRINQDLPLMRAICCALLAEESAHPGTVFDRAFIDTYTAGFSAWEDSLRSTSPETYLPATGISTALFAKAMKMILPAKRIIICYAMGLTQHENSVDTIKEMVNLLLCKGSIGKKGAGICPVRGHSNVQGDRTVGIWEKITPAFAERLRTYFHFRPPLEMGYDTRSAIQAMHDGKAKVFFAMGGNFLSAAPDTAYTAAGLRKCALTVQVSTKLNRSHLVTGEEAIILPCLGRTEIDVQAAGPQFVSCENSMGVVQKSQGILEPAGGALKSECAIIAELATATLGEASSIKWRTLVQDYDHIRAAIEACVPGFDQYNERVRQPGGFYLPNGPRERKFNTPSGKAHFTVSPHHPIQLAADEFLMMTVRSHDQYNTTIYGLDDRYRGIYQERRVVLINPEDVDAMGFTAKQTVSLVSEYDGQLRYARTFQLVPYPIPRGNIATYFPEANTLVPITRAARESNTPISKSVRVKIIAE